MKLSETGYYEEHSQIVREKIFNTWFEQMLTENEQKEQKSDLRTLKQAQNSKQDVKT